MRATLKNVDGSIRSVDTQSWAVICHWLEEETKGWPNFVNATLGPITIEVRPS